MTAKEWICLVEMRRASGMTSFVCAGVGRVWVLPSRRARYAEVFVCAVSVVGARACIK